MKKIILMFILVFAVVALAEVKIEVNQSIFYADGAITMSSLPIDLKKALKTGGSVYLKYDFKVTETGFFDSDTSFIFLKLPDGLQFFENFIKTTSFSGAKDVSLDLLEVFKNKPESSSIRESVGRLPKVKKWIVLRKICDEKNAENCRSEDIESFSGFALMMKNKEGNTASITFCFDFSAILDYSDEIKEQKKYAKLFNWISENLLHEIPIDINFHTLWPYIGYAVPNAEHVAKYGYDRFWMILGPRAGSYDEGSNSNHSYTIMVK